jgi:predicted DNA-binding transcriptional regulator AlpA
VRASTGRSGKEVDSRGGFRRDAAERVDALASAGRDPRTLQEIVGRGEAARRTGIREDAIPRLLHRGEFPEPVARLGERCVWSAAELERYPTRVGPRRDAGVWDGQFLRAAETAELLGQTVRAFRQAVARAQWHRVPPPDGRIGITLYWRRDSVEEWVARHRGVQ